MLFCRSGLDCLILARACSRILGQLADGLEAGWPRMTLDVICAFAANSLMDWGPGLFSWQNRGWGGKQNHAGFQLAHLVCYCLVGLSKWCGHAWGQQHGSNLQRRGLGRQRSLGASNAVRLQAPSGLMAGSVSGGRDLEFRLQVFPSVRSGRMQWGWNETNAILGLWHHVCGDCPTSSLPDARRRNAQR